MSSLRDLKLDIDVGLAQISPPMRRAYVQAAAGATTIAGPFARLEGGVLVMPSLAAFAFGEWQPDESSVGGGLRWTF